MFISALLLALSVLLLLHKMPRLHQTALAHPAVSDVTITLAVLALGVLSTTFIGMITGVIAGVLLSMYFTVAPRVRAFSLPKRREKVINPLKSPIKRQKEVTTMIQQSATVEDIQIYIDRLQGKPRQASEKELLALLSTKSR
jgi:MFS superfamily sulfate permease-like transporter